VHKAALKLQKYYVVVGYFPVGVSNSKEMAAGATDYCICKTGFVNGLIAAALTFSIYTQQQQL
jgi:hypothetical protein